MAGVWTFSGIAHHQLYYQNLLEPAVVSELFGTFYHSKVNHSDCLTQFHVSEQSSEVITETKGSELAQGTRWAAMFPRVKSQEQNPTGLSSLERKSVEITHDG